MTEADQQRPGADATKPSAARLYDYFLGGTNNLPVDREAAEKLRAQVPDIADAMWANRGFHGRAAAWMARHGIRQFIDIGSGLPTQNNTHETVHRVTPDAKVVYVDNDPAVAAHSAPLLARDGTTVVITADLRDPDSVLSHDGLREMIDLAEPTGVLMTAVVHFVADESDPWGLVARYMAAMAPGSYLALSHGTHDKIPPHQIQAGVNTYAKSQSSVHFRTKAEIERFFYGLELVSPYQDADPAITYVSLWGAEDPDLADDDSSRGVYCGVARRP